ncbi:MAG: ROK family protein [Verrucomicrobiota bacterium]
MTSTPPKTALEDCYVGIEIGGTKLQLVVGSSSGIIFKRYRFAVEPDCGAEGIRAHIAATLPEILAEWRPRAIGVGYGGPVDWKTGKIIKSYHVQGWHEFPLGRWLQSVSGIPAFVENDANAAALGESRCGAGRGCDPVFYVTIGSGVGGGLVSDGRIFHGFTGGEAEIGHLRLSEDGRTPESCCSGWSLDREIRAAVAANPESELARLVANSAGNEARHLGVALAKCDPVALAVLKAEAKHLAHALSHVAHLCHPEVIVLGGGVSLLGEALRRSVSAELRGMIMDAFLPGPRVVLAGLREDTVPVGALILAAQRLEQLTNSKTENNMQTWLQNYVNAQHKALDSVPLEAVERLTQTVRSAWLRDAQIFAIGNGGSAANASHFATDLGKGSSDKLPQRFRILSLADNVAWLTALGNDYSYDDSFKRQLENFARPGDVLIAASVSGNSPNLVRAFEWANELGMETAVIVGAKRGKLAEVARQTIVIEDTHYGRVEDVQMHILHMLCYAFMELPELAKAS